MRAWTGVSGSNPLSTLQAGQSNYTKETQQKAVIQTDID